MKTLIVSYHNPNFVNTTHYREKAIEYLGHELITFDDRSFMIPGRIREKIKTLHDWDLKRLNQELMTKVKQLKPDVCFVIGGQRTLPETVARIRQLGVKIALWTTDVPEDFENILAAAPHYDHLFCAGTEAVDIFNAKGFNRNSWVPFACDPFYHKPVALTESEKKEYGHDAVFVGSCYPNRAQQLESIADLDIAIWGPYWDELDDQSKLKAKCVSVKMNYDQWVKIYSAAKIVLVTHYYNPQVPCHQASPKLFEAMACGSFVLVDDQKDVRALFQDGKQVVFFKDAQDLRDKIQYYAAHDKERNVIAQEGQREVLNKHNYRHRFQQMLKILGIEGKEGAGHV